ncbi:MAG: hydrogenase expression/formation protein [bacterium]|nr:hydrogenase expression/formation protein [bacterium]
MDYLPLGKLKLEQLQALLQKYASTDDERVILGPGVGEDATAIDFGESCLVAKTDPITFVADDIGWYTIVINANDIATCGATPKWFLATILLPEKRTTEEDVEKIFAQLSEACRCYNIALCGGHTEVTYGLDRPIVVGQMLGEVDKGKLIRTSGAKPGNDIVLSKGLAVEATSIIARVKQAELAQTFSSEFLQRCRNFLHDPGISVLEDAAVAVASGAVSAMHDPTEGGLATGLHELAEAAGVGVQVDFDAIPIFQETALLCREFQLDPLGVIASGALLMTIDPAATEHVLEGLAAKQIQAAVIGKILPASEGRNLLRGGELAPLKIYHQDELTKIFD